MENLSTLEVVSKPPPPPPPAPLGLKSHKRENYIVLVKKRWHRSALTKLRCGAHRLNPKQVGGGGGGIRPQAGPSLCCAEMVSSRKLKLSDFYYILIGLNSEYKPVPSDIHCCHGNAIVEGSSEKFWLKSVENCIFLLKSFSNLSLGLLFVISISKLAPLLNFMQIGLKTKKLGFSTFLAQQSLKYKMTS